MDILMIRFINSVRIGQKEQTFASYTTHEISEANGVFKVIDKSFPSRVTHVPLANVAYFETGEVPKVDAKRSGK